MTFNLSTAMLKDLDDACYRMKQMNKGNRVPKSSFVELAIQRAIDEFNRNPESSEIFTELKNS